MICKQDCTKRIPVCREGHTCVMMCFQRCECQCPDSELMQRALPSMRPKTDASAARRMILHGLDVSRQAGFVHAMQAVQRQPHGPPLAHRPWPAFEHGNSQPHNYHAPRRPVPPGPTVIRESVITSSTGARPLGPANITHYHAQTRLFLTPNAAAAVAASPPSPIVAPTPAYRVPEPIVEVDTRNVANGQFSRHAVNAAASFKSQDICPAQPPSRPPFTSRAPQLAKVYAQASRLPITNGISTVAAGLPIRGALNVSFNRVPAPATIKHTVATTNPSLSTTMMKVFVAGLPCKFSEARISKLLHEYGDVMTPQLWKTRGRAPIGSGTVIMMRPDGERAIKELNGKVYEARYLKVEEFEEGLQEEWTSCPRGRVSPVTRLRRAKSLKYLRDRGARMNRRPATPEVDGTKDEANSWPRNAPVVTEAGAVPLIPEIPSALERPPGVPSKPDLTQDILAKRARAFADCMETVADGTEVRTLIGDSRINWRPATAMATMREVPEEREDLIDFGDDNKENEKEENGKESDNDMMTFSTVAKVEVELMPGPVAGAISLLDM